MVRIVRNNLWGSNEDNNRRSNDNNEVRFKWEISKEIIGNKRKDITEKRLFVYLFQ